jgi:hypothetical protein
VQYGGRVLRIVMHKIPAFLWWCSLIWQHLPFGRVGHILAAARIIILEGKGQTAMIGAKLIEAALEAKNAAADAYKAASSSSVLSPAAETTLRHEQFSTSLIHSYTSDTSATSAQLYASPLYFGTVSRLDALTVALSSARRVIRLAKWSYTMPSWVKSFGEWRKQVNEGMERQMKQIEEERRRQEQVHNEEGEAAEAATPPDDGAAATVAPPFRFSHPHPPHLWRRLPWLSSVELLDLTLAILTDMADDCEWLSRYRLFPTELGRKAGRISVTLWCTTVVLDLMLTARILRHYHYQRSQIMRQIEETKSAYEVAKANLAACQMRRSEAAERRFRRELEGTPFKRGEWRTATHYGEDGQIQEDEADVPHASMPVPIPVGNAPHRSSSFLSASTAGAAGGIGSGAHSPSSVRSASGSFASLPGSPPLMPSPSLPRGDDAAPVPLQSEWDSIGTASSDESESAQHIYSSKSVVVVPGDQASQSADASTTDVPRTRTPSPHTASTPATRTSPSRVDTSSSAAASVADNDDASLVEDPEDENAEWSSDSSPDYLAASTHEAHAATVVSIQRLAGLHLQLHAISRTHSLQVLNFAVSHRRAHARSCAVRMHRGGAQRCECNQLPMCVADSLCLCCCSCLCSPRAEVRVRPRLRAANGNECAHRVERTRARDGTRERHTRSIQAVHHHQAGIVDARNDPARETCQHAHAYVALR